MIKHRAFTLVELLVVMAVAGVVLAAVVPAFQSMGDAAKLRQAAAGVLDQIDAARQLAEVSGTTVQVRLLRGPALSNATGNYTGIQIWSGDENLILDKPVGLPEGVAILEENTLSPMLSRMSSGTMPGTAALNDGSRWAGGAFAAFRVRPSGAIELRPAEDGPQRARLFITIAPDRPTGGVTPVNYATIQINPDTARPLLYRP
jgi:uncharacterized protein (TIGR02596 family)